MFPFYCHSSNDYNNQIEVQFSCYFMGFHVVVVVVVIPLNKNITKKEKRGRKKDRE